MVKFIKKEEMLLFFYDQWFFKNEIQFPCIIFKISFGEYPRLSSISGILFRASLSDVMFYISAL